MFFRHAFYLLLLLSASAAFARNIVVDQKSKSASDDNPGSNEKPLKTISAAVVKVRAGDTIIVHAGDYREVVIVLASGTAEAPITIQAAPGETPVIKGSDVIKYWQHENGSVWKATLKPFPPRNDSAKNSTFYNTNDVRQVFTRDGALLDAHRLQRVTKRDSMKEDTFFCDPKASMLYVWLPDSKSPAERPPEASVRTGWLNIFGSHVVVRGMQMRHSSTASISNSPASCLQGEGNMLEKCLISWGDFVGISIMGNGNRLSNCLIGCNGDSGVNGTGEHHTIEGCRVVYNNVDRYKIDWHAGGAKLIPDFRHGSIRHNEFARNLGGGLWLDGGCNENVIDGNVTHDNEGPGIVVEISRGNVVLNNICYANRNYLSGSYRDDKGVVTDLAISEQRILPSRLLNIYHAGDGRGIYISSSPDTKVLHNTVYLNEGEGICVESEPRGLGNERMETRGDTVANNISVFNKGSQLTLRAAPESKGTITSDHNLLFALGAMLAKNGWAGSPALTMSDWQKMSSQDVHSIDADPRFALAAMEDFRVLPKSPALNTGEAIPEADHDFFGRARGKDKTTIGACEEAADNYPIPVWQSLSETIRSAHELGGL